MTLSEAYDYASCVMVENMLARDAEEGIGAFIEKRAPQWQDSVMPTADNPYNTGPGSQLRELSTPMVRTQS
jgi:hypothetical protein